MCMNGTNREETRQSNIELLRIVSMCMIIAMHYMTKGMNIPKLSADHSLHNIAFWIIYAFCLSSVNAYVFISGYFDAGSKWSIGRVIRLWLEVLFYSILIPVIMNAFGMINFKASDLSVKQQVFLPVTYEHYWFASSYVMMYLFAPVLSSAADKLDKKKLGTVIMALLVVFCGFKSVIPYLIPWDKYGNDVIWFMILYLIAGYIRNYGIPVIDSGIMKNRYEMSKDGRKSAGRKGLIVYVSFSLITFAIALVISYIVRVTGKMEYYMDMTYCYNYVTVLIASIGLFYVFLMIDLKANKMLNRIAGCTFGIYLFHENIILRGLWPDIPGMTASYGKWWQIPHMLLCIVIIFAVGCIVDIIRKAFFDLIQTQIGKIKDHSVS